MRRNSMIAPLNHQAFLISSRCSSSATCFTHFSTRSLVSSGWRSSSMARPTKWSSSAEAFGSLKMIPRRWPVTDDGRAARLNDVADGAQRVAEVFCVIFLVAAAEQRHQFAIEVDLFQRREEVIPVTLRFTVVPRSGYRAAGCRGLPRSSLLLLAMS